VAKLTAEQQKQLDDLTALAAAEDDSDFEIEIGSGDNFARVPYSKGRSWLQKTFGIDLDPEPEPEPEPVKGSKAKDGDDKGGVVRFGRRVS
jgi:hypothetical protein